MYKMRPVMLILGRRVATTVRATTLISGYPHGVAVTPDGLYVIVADTTGKAVSVVDAHTAQLVATISGMQEPNDALATMG